MSMISKDLRYEMTAMIISHNDENINFWIVIDMYSAFISSPEPIWNNLGREGSTFGLKADKSSFNSNPATKWFQIYQILTLVVFVCVQK